MSKEELATRPSPTSNRPNWWRFFRNKEFQKFTAALVLFIALVYLASAGNSGTGNLPASYVTTAGTPERRTEEIFRSILGQWHVSGRIPTIASLEHVKQTAGPDQGGFLVSVAYRTGADTKFMFIREAIRITERMFSEPELTDIKAILLRPHITGLDDYGKEKELQTGKALIRRAVAAKMDLQNITADGFEVVLKREGVFEFRDLRK